MKATNENNLPTQAEIYGAKNRTEQIEIAKRCLVYFWDERHRKMPDSAFSFSREHARSCFVANKMAMLVRKEDNSLVGFPRRFRNFQSASLKLQYQQNLLDEYFFCLPTPLPPQFVALSNYKGSQRYIGIWYAGTKATISDGRTQHSFPFYEAYEPLVRHIAVEYFVMTKQAFLGADDGEASHALVLDTVANKIYLGRLNAAHFFLGTQQPDTPEEEEKAERETEELLKRFENSNTLEDMQSFGMFQFFAPVNNRRKEVEEMTKFLTENTPEQVTEIFQQVFSS